MTATKTSAPLKLGVAGLGTVGLGLLTLLKENQEALKKRLGRDLQITAVSARKKTQERLKLIPADATWYEDGRKIVSDPNVDVVIELIGGSEGIAFDIVTSALKTGKDVITGNKALIAQHGQLLDQLAKENGAQLLFEAAVAGGIPAIKTVKEALIGDRLQVIMGILNGTSNYVLSNMRAKGLDLEPVLKKAQELGYAEADPTADIDGYDAGHKLAILTHLAFGVPIDFASIPLTGMRHITMDDHLYAEEVGCRIKLLAYVRHINGRFSTFVAPCFVNQKNALAHVDGVTNAVFIQGEAIGTLFLEGPGAGAGPTALAVIADIADIACGAKPAITLENDNSTRLPRTEEDTKWYVRFSKHYNDADLTRILSLFSRHNVQVDTFLQKPEITQQADAPLALITKTANGEHVEKLCDDIEQMFSSQEKPSMMRIIDL